MVSLQEMEAIQQDRAVMEDSRTAMEKLLETEQFKFSQILLSDDLKNVPDRIPKQFWVFFDKEMSITNFTPDDIRWLMFQFDIAKLDVMMEKPDFEMKFEEMKDFTNLKVKAFSKMKRSTEPDRERKLLATQIRQFISNETEQVSGGWLSKIGGMFKGANK